eukprot:s1684_g6.t1
MQQGLSDKAKFLLLHQQKPIIRRYLLAAGDATNVLQGLPSDFRQLPNDVRQAAFGDGSPADVTSFAVAIAQAVRTFPLRWTNRAVLSTGLATCQQGQEGSVSEVTARAVQAAVQGAVAAVRASGAPAAESVRPTAPPLLALMDAPRGDVGTANADTLMSTGHSDSNSVLHAEGLHAAAAVEPVSTSPPTVAEQLATLRNGASTKTQASKGLKKPASKVALKRPAASSTSTGCPESKQGRDGKVAKEKGSKQVKSKTKQKAKTASLPKGKLSREERKAAVLAIVPKAMQQRYKNGCSKCLRMGPKEVKKEASDSDYSYVETEHEEEPAAEEGTRAEREGGSEAPAESVTSAALPGGREAERRPRRAHRSRAAAAPESARAKAPASTASAPEGSKGKGKRRRRGDTQSCQICGAPVGKHESSLSQHQYWNEDCNARRIWQDTQCSWTSARRQALQLKEDREDAYWNLPCRKTADVSSGHVTPAPSLAAKREMEGRADEAPEEDEEDRTKEPKKKEKTKKKKRRHHRSPSREVERDRRRSKRPPESDEDEDLPRVKRGPGGTFILQFTSKAH